MQIVLRGIEGKFCFVYLDNILVCSKTFEDRAFTAPAVRF